MNNAKRALLSTGLGIAFLLAVCSSLAGHILKSTKLADLPVEMAEYFLSVYLETAQTVGLNVPESILRQAQTIIR